MTEITEFEIALRRWMEVIMTRSMRDWSLYVKSSGLSMPQFRLLMHLYYQGSCGISHLSDEMSVTSAAASQLVDKLVQGNLLHRAEDPNDRRAKQITLSDYGREFVKNGIEQRYNWISELADSLTVDESQAIMVALTVLTNKTLDQIEHEHTGIEKD